MVRARAVNDHPAFLDMLADVVLATVRRYAGGRPLPLLPPSRSLTLNRLGATSSNCTAEDRGLYMS